MRLLAVPLLAVALIAGCGGSTRSSGPGGCVTVYFTTGATKSQEDAVRNELEHLRPVRSVRFVSKEQALAALSKRYPDLTKQLSRNPLPDSLVVSLKPKGGSLERWLEAAKPGVEIVKPSGEPCTTGE